MPGLRYLSQKPENIAPRIEQLVRTELKAPTPIPYQILPGTSGGATPGSLLSEWAHAQMRLSQQVTALCYVHFSLAWPRPFELQVSVIRHGLSALVGKCTFAVPMAKPVRGPVNLEPVSLMGPKGFTGEPATSARLNGNRELLIKAHRLAISTSTIGRTKITIPHYFQIQPARTGSLLVVNRLARSFFFSVNMGIGDMLAFVPMMEYYL